MERSSGMWLIAWNGPSLSYHAWGFFRIQRRSASGALSTTFTGSPASIRAALIDAASK